MRDGDRVRQMSRPGIITGRPCKNQDFGMFAEEETDRNIYTKKKVTETAKVKTDFLCSLVAEEVEEICGNQVNLVIKKLSIT